MLKYTRCKDKKKVNKTTRQQDNKNFYYKNKMIDLFVYNINLLTCRHVVLKKETPISESLMRCKIKYVVC